ncbi:MAG: PIG-L family deacetylase [Anaerolineae bacterium]|jgi:N-acetyl-1-D-myo-inositol-2-amino-2-deoxy-alpha-D-glucopyranoside deacetylase
MDNEKKQLLAVFAHPDDETFGTGGTLARYASNGTEVTLVCATRGEAGEIADPALATPENLGQVREAELECAARQMGVQEILLLDYRDSGMAGTAENDDPRALVNAPAKQVVQQIVAIIRRLRPQVVVTFDPQGVYGHPDHIAIHRHTVTAFHAAADPTRFPELGAPWQAERLFYSIVPRSMLRTMRDWLASMGEDTRDLEGFEQAAAQWPDEKIHVSLDVSEAVDTKWSALSCHQTQFGPDNLFRRMPENVAKQILSQEHFALAWPAPKPQLQLEELFAGL